MHFLCSWFVAIQQELAPVKERLQGNRYEKANPGGTEIYKVKYFCENAKTQFLLQIIVNEC